MVTGAPAPHGCTARATPVTSERWEHQHQVGAWPHQTAHASVPLELPMWETPSATGNLPSKDSVSSIPPANAFHAIVHRACQKGFKVCAVKVWVWARLTAKSSSVLPHYLQLCRANTSPSTASCHRGHRDLTARITFCKVRTPGSCKSKCQSAQRTGQGRCSIF